ncbi:hypothetical protein Q9L58_010968 [Maublancomyces gigas]|uniref:HTH tetR-type domain-containing protein n=1 Tax=Discina gigas TaxID=1032678 RepID=A0ABR3G2K2_9PEZI
MAAVAAEVGGSKGTLYGYFPNKEDLFAAFIREAGEDVFLPLQAEFDVSGSVADILKTFGVNYLKLLLKPEIIAIIRLVVSESLRSPELADIFFDIGPRRVLDRFEHLFNDLKISGRLKLSDPARAALEFKVLCEAGLYEPFLIGGRKHPGMQEVVANVDAAVDLIQERYGNR